jgi:hypothetical protein
VNHNIQIEIILKYLINEKRLLNKTVYIFGMNGYAKIIVDTLRSFGITVKAIVDNNINKCGKIFMNINVAIPEDVLIPYDENSLILIASKYYYEMKKQLEIMGYDEQKHLLKLLDASMLCSPDFMSDDLFLSQINSAKNGMELYKELQEKYSGPIPVFLAPVSSIGDIFLLGLYFNKYIEKQAIKSYIFVVPGKAGARIAETYGISNIEIITKDQADALINFRMLMGRNNAEILILHSGYLHQRIICNIAMYEKMTWLDNYKRFLFGLDENELYTKRKVNVNKSEIYKVLSMMNLEMGKTVILAPYAQTMTELSISFWSKLAEKLKECGYSVCTNVAGEEKPIPNTIPLYLSLDGADFVVEYAGYFIGLRSGFCDVISMAKCKKIILYSNEVFECIKVIDFYSLNKMGLCKDAIEIEVSYNEDNDISMILSNLI